LFADRSSVVVYNGTPAAIAVLAQLGHEVGSVALSLLPVLVQIVVGGIALAFALAAYDFRKRRGSQVATEGVTIPPHQGRTSDLAGTLFLELEDLLIALFAPRLSGLCLHRRSGEWVRLA